MRPLHAEQPSTRLYTRPATVLSAGRLLPGPFITGALGALACRRLGDDATRQPSVGYPTHINSPYILDMTNESTRRGRRCACGAPPAPGYLASPSNTAPHRSTRLNSLGAVSLYTAHARTAINNQVHDTSALQRYPW